MNESDYLIERDFYNAIYSVTRDGWKDGVSDEVRAEIHSRIALIRVSLFDAVESALNEERDSLKNVDERFGVAQAIRVLDRLRPASESST